MSDFEKNETVVIRGLVEDVVFHNETNDFTVFEISTVGEIVTAVGVLPEISSGEEVKLTGKWDHHNVFGRQFKIETCERSLPDTASKLYKYLASGTIKGIGPKIAMKIIERFGEKSFDILENDPEKLATISGISHKKAVDICDEFNRQYAMRRIIIELENYGIKPYECTSIYKYFGAESINVIKENPYILCGTVNGFDFERAELLASKMHDPIKNIYRFKAGIIHIIRHNLGNGHTCLPKRKILQPASALLSISEDEAEEVISELITEKQLVSSDLDGEAFIFLPALFAAEKYISERLNNIISFPPSEISTIAADIARSEKRNSIQYADKQKEAINVACNKGLLILTGGPGTGKTTTLNGIIEIFEKLGIDSFLCAPTGRAAKRLSEVTGKEAKTIHRLLEVEWDADDKPVFRKNSQDPFRCGALIVDEMSMVDAELFAALLEAVPIGCRLVLVGDPDQLPSVGPGNVLNDIISSGIMPVVALTEIFRQAQESLIVVNSHKIVHGIKPVLNDKKNDFFFMRRDDSLQNASLICELFSKRLPDAYGFDSMNDIQILCPSRKGDCGTENLNKKLQEVLNPYNKFKSEIRTPSGRIFREGDRVMQIKNNYKLPWTKGYEDGEGVFNGDIGLLAKINLAAGTMKIIFDDRETDYPTDNLSELELAYAVTVHKSQGSEYPAVIIPVSDCPPMLRYRNLLYTAVTRAKKILVLAGKEEIIAEMTANNNEKKRYSSLKYFLTADK